QKAQRFTPGKGGLPLVSLRQRDELRAQRGILQPVLPDEGFETAFRCQAYCVPGAQQARSQGHIWLNISTCTSRQDCDAHRFFSSSKTILPFPDSKRSQPGCTPSASLRGPP